MNAVYLSVPCNTCEEPMYYGRLWFASETHLGTPVLHIDDAISQITFYCDNCGGEAYTGDFEDFVCHEEGEIPEEYEEEEDDDAE